VTAVDFVDEPAANRRGLLDVGDDAEPRDVLTAIDRQTLLRRAMLRSAK